MPATPNPEKILRDGFLSYSRKNHLIAEKLLRLLSEDDLNIVMDVNDLRGGEVWKRRLTGLIEHAQNVIFLISPESLASKYCLWEVDLAASLNKRLIPVLVGGADPEDLPESLSAYHWIDAREDVAKAARQIADALRTDQKWTEMHTQLGLRAQARSQGGDLLRGLELSIFESAIVTYRGKRPFPTGAQTAYLIECRTAARKRLGVLVGITLIILIALSFLGFNWWVEQRNASYMSLRRQGESALVSVGRGEIGPAVAALDYVTRHDTQKILPEYKQVADYWQPRLRPLRSVISSVPPGDLLEWRGRSYFKTGPESLALLPAEVPFRMATIDQGRKAVFVDASGVALRAMPGMEKLLTVTAKMRLHPMQIYEIPQSKYILATGYHVAVEADEDEDTRQPNLLVLLTTGFATGSTMAPPEPPPPDSEENEDPFEEPEEESEDAYIPHLVTGTDGNAAIFFRTERMFSLERCFVDKEGAEVVIEGSEKGYDDSPPLRVRWRVDLASVKMTTEDRANETSTAQSPPATPIPTRLTHEFPQRIDEHEFWSMASAEDLPPEWQALLTARANRDNIFADTLASVDLTTVGDGDIYQERFTYDYIDCGVRKTDTGSFLWHHSVTNSHSTLVMAKVDSKGKAEWCRAQSAQVIASQYGPSPDQRWFIRTSGNGGEQPLTFIDMSRRADAQPPALPTKLVAGIAFEPDSKRFAALTEDDEILIYSTDGPDAPALVRRARLGVTSAATDQPGEVLEPVKTRPLVFVAGGIVVGTALDGRLFAVLADTGELLWTKPLNEAVASDPPTLQAGPQGPYVLVTSARSVQLFHAHSGTALTDSADFTLLRQKFAMPPVDTSDARPADRDSIFVAAQGEFAIKMDETHFLWRHRQHPEASAHPPSTTSEEATGISAADGRTPLPPEYPLTATHSPSSQK